MSAHFETGEPIPDNLLNNLLHTKSQSLKMLDHQQVYLTTFNLAAFTPASQKDAEEMDFAEL
jgi:metallopeptidase MepB